MKKTILILCMVVLALASQAQGIYNSGARIVSQSGSCWVLANGNFTLNSRNAVIPATFANLKIEAGASLIIEPQSFLTVSGTLTNSAGNGGLVISSGSEGTGSLIHSTPAVPATINRYITGSTGLTAMTFHLLSVPLTPASVSLSALFIGSYLYDFNVANNAWHGLNNALDTPLDETRGYMIYSPVDAHTYQFAGAINAGSFSPLVTYTTGCGNNLVPNPYPSAIDWNADGWTKTGIANSVYVWPSGGSNYATYVNGTENNGGSNIIPAGQAFIVKATSAPTFIMTDAVRVHSANAFLKSDDATSDLLRITATSGGMTDEAVIRFTDAATTHADPDYDSWKLYGSDGAPQLYTLAADNQMLAINSLPYLHDAYTVPLNFEQKSTAEVSLNFSNIESFNPDISIHLQDLLSSQTINLREQNVYTFSQTEGNDAKRFKILFGGTIGIGETQAPSARMWISEQMLYISPGTFTGEKARIEICALTGQVLLSETLSLSSLTTLNLSAIPASVIIARMIVGKEVITAKGILMK